MLAPSWGNGTGAMHRSLANVMFGAGGGGTGASGGAPPPGLP